MKLPRNRIQRALMLSLAVLVILQVEGCYYMQAIRGHSDLMSKRRPVGDVIADEQVPAALKEKLMLVQAARDFSVTELLLPDNDSYRTYADLERDYVVWNVFAAPEFSLQAKTWCYPVAGCVAYRGYFREKSARDFGDGLREQGFDVAVGGVSAYSTLGRFADPVLNTMMRWSEVDLVATIFHELAHQKLYIKGDSAFNESFATAVADIGVARWLEKTGELDRLAVYRQHQALRIDMQGLVNATRTRLSDLYAQSMDDASKRSRKQQILDELSADAQALIDEDGRDIRNWLAAPLNNARLVSMNLYQGRVDAFRRIYADCGESLDCFYERTAVVSEMEAAERGPTLDALAD